MKANRRKATFRQRGCGFQCFCCSSGKGRDEGSSSVGRFLIQDADACALLCDFCAYFPPLQTHARVLPPRGGAGEPVWEAAVFAKVTVPLPRAHSFVREQNSCSAGFGCAVASATPGDGRRRVSIAQDSPKPFFFFLHSVGFGTQRVASTHTQTCTRAHTHRQKTKLGVRLSSPDVTVDLCLLQGLDLMPRSSDRRTSGITMTLPPVHVCIIQCGDEDDEEKLDVQLGR